MRKTAILLSIVLIIFASSCQKNTPRNLFNGKNLSNWNTYIGAKEKGDTPIGLNNDTLNIFSVVEIDGEKVIRISGEIDASLATKDEFENYHLSLEIKWGNKVFSRRNSGLLYHSYGDFGEGLNVWMSSHELQLWTGNMGDSYRMGKSYCEIPMIGNNENKFTYNKGVKKAPSIPDTDTQIITKDGDYEKSIGQWNTIELYCFNRTAIHVINGKVNMVIFNSGKYISKGNIEPLTKGKIQFQSEGGELFLKNIKISPLKKLPSSLLK